MKPERRKMHLGKLVPQLSIIFSPCCDEEIKRLNGVSKPSIEGMIVKISIVNHNHFYETH
eukprot:m.76316 g.76316  ORF g.76316 m.76316 type:complete len:60 (+) comp8512_c0_seq3:5593-5772(+)